MTKLITRNESTLQEKRITFETIELFIKELYRLNLNLEFFIKNVLCGVLAMWIIFPMEAKRAYFLKTIETIF